MMHEGHSGSSGNGNYRPSPEVVFAASPGDASPVLRFGSEEPATAGAEGGGTVRRGRVGAVSPAPPDAGYISVLLSRHADLLRSLAETQEGWGTGKDAISAARRVTVTAAAGGGSFDAARVVRFLQQLTHQCRLAGALRDTQQLVMDEVCAVVQSHEAVLPDLPPEDIEALYAAMGAAEAEVGGKGASGGGGVATGRSDGGDSARVAALEAENARLKREVHTVTSEAETCRLVFAEYEAHYTELLAAAKANAGGVAAHTAAVAAVPARSDGGRLPQGQALAAAAAAAAAATATSSPSLLSTAPAASQDGGSNMRGPSSSPFVPLPPHVDEASGTRTPEKTVTFSPGKALDMYIDSEAF